MNKVMGTAVWALIGLFYASYTIALAQPVANSEEEKAQQVWALMQKSPVQRSGRNMWVALTTWQQPHLTHEQRQASADAYAAQVEHWNAAYVADYVADKDNRAPLPTLPGKRTLPSARDSLLCGFGTQPNDCLATVRQQPQAINAALAPYADVLEQIADLAYYDYYASPLSAHANLQWPDLRFISLSLSAHALTHINGDSHAALTGLCNDARVGRLLIRDADTDTLLPALMGRRVLNSSLIVAAHIIAELPLDTSLPAECNDVFVPFNVEEISLCPAMRGEFAFMRSYLELQKQRLERRQKPFGTEQLSDWDNALWLQAQYNGVMCLPQTQQALLKDEKFSISPIKSIWLEQCADDNMACATSKINRPSYARYVHQMQDTAAQLQMMQIVLWLRQQPAQPLNNDYLRTAVPADIHTSTQRPMTLSNDGNALEMSAYDERAIEPIRLPLPHALR